MKKKVVCSFLCCLLLISFNSTVYASVEELKDAKLTKCVDGDTANFVMDGKEIKARFLAINTPEITGEREYYGEQASAYTCEMLRSAKVIQLAYDDKSTQQDKYQRELVWVYIDGKLLQSKLVEEGYAEVNYIFGDYAYVDELKELESTAKTKKLGMWSEASETMDLSWILTIVVGILLLLPTTNKSFRRKLIKQLKKKR